MVTYQQQHKYHLYNPIIINIFIIELQYYTNKNWDMNNGRAKLICQINNRSLHLEIIMTYNSIWTGTKNPHGTIITHHLMHQNWLKYSIIRKVYLLLEVHSSYLEVKSQSKQILQNTHMTMVFERQSEGHQGSKSSKGSHYE